MVGDSRKRRRRPGLASASLPESDSAAHCGHSDAVSEEAANSRPQLAHMVIAQLSLGYSHWAILDAVFTAICEGFAPVGIIRNRRGGGASTFFSLRLFKSSTATSPEPESATSSMLSCGVNASAPGLEPTCTVVISLRVVASKTATLLESKLLTYSV